MVILGETKMKILIKPTVGIATVTDLDVEPTDTIKEIKEQASTTQAVSPNSAVLIYNGEVMDEKKRLKDYGVHEGDTLILGPKHQKGGNSLSSLSFFSNQHSNNDICSRRISQEAKLIRAQNLPLKPTDPMHWTATIRADRGTWGGHQYKTHFTIPKAYPYVPPTVNWKTPLYPKHPNIHNETGWVCLSILQSSYWKPEYTLITVYKGLQWLLEHPHYEHHRRFSWLFQS